MCTHLFIQASVAKSKLIKLLCFFFCPFHITTLISKLLPSTSTLSCLSSSQSPIQYSLPAIQPFADTKECKDSLSNRKQPLKAILTIWLPYISWQTPDLMYSAAATDKRDLQTQHNPLLKGQQEKDLSLPWSRRARMRVSCDANINLCLSKTGP